ncbi:hypothetical protein JF66_19010 [Cryobacterium sp. MLB-32]|uniref:type IV pilus modification PilV family protein n=1 Tax=Cryobacterium sp. MLB-32 TaxID=1529318 RepID=UPI0004E62E8F|nr:prepilin-type N-terminal cleavage/methylation domain-containing protein [Cryobacterium sp. MLB-32]KFF58381.1 hypothetical protein JF66_19010 [Cryobacterium sp. MLB-32]
MNERRRNPARATESGFGLIEVVVAMFLLTILAVAFLPVLVQGVQRSAANGTLAAATQLVNKEMENARAQTTCSALTASTFAVLDPRGVTLTVARTVGGACPVLTTAYPLTVPVAVTVSRADTGAVLSVASTLIFVAAK